MPELREDNVLFRHWEAARSKAVLLLVHGLGAHSSRWDFLGGYLSRHGYSAYAIELKGFGQTKERPRGHIGSFEVYYRDLMELLAIIRKENPGKKVFLLGESMGGLIAFLLGATHPTEFAGLICISPAFANGMKFTLSQYFTAFSALLYNQKKLIAMPFTSAMCTRDKEYQKIMDNNPDELRVASSRLLLEILRAQVKARSELKNYQLPVLFLLAGRDHLVDEKTSKKVFPKIASPDKKLIEYPEMLHALSIDLNRDKVFHDILEWLCQRS